MRSPGCSSSNDVAPRTATNRLSSHCKSSIAVRKIGPESRFRADAHICGATQINAKSYTALQTNATW